MKSKLIVLSVVVLAFCVSQVFAEGGHDHGSHDDVVNEEIISSEAVNIGNKICPISGEVIADVDDGKGVQVEHEGKVYNLCCSMCAKDFKKNPEKFITIIENNLAEGNDPGRDYGSDHDDQGEHEHDEGISKKDEGHHAGSHENHDH